MILQKFPVFSLFNREFGGDGFARDCLHRHHSTYLYHWINVDFEHAISSNIPGPFRSVRQLALRAETIWCRWAESPSADVSFSPFGGTTVSGDRHHFLVGQGETRTETLSFCDGGLGCLGHGGQDRSGEAQDLALFGPFPCPNVRPSAPISHRESSAKGTRWEGRN